VRSHCRTISPQPTKAGKLTLIVSGSEDKTLRLWEVESGCEVGRFDGDDPIPTIGFNGKCVAVGSSTGRVHVLDALLVAEADKGRGR
jgi:WD40 repeat protein